MGNHDDVDGLRAHLDAPGEAGEPLQYSLQLGPLRLIACDTTVRRARRRRAGPGAPRAGSSGAGARPRTLTVLAMHHPPVLIGVRLLDEIGLAEADRLALAELMAANPQVKRIVVGHVHRGDDRRHRGLPRLRLRQLIPAAGLDLGPASEIALVREPPVFGLHVVVGTS